MHKKIWFLFLTVFLDMLGIGILIPVIPQLLGEPSSPYYLLHASQVDMGLILLGILMSIYPLASFFMAPVLGAWSDKYGRKPVLLISILGTAISYFVFAYAIVSKDIVLLFISRLVDGLTGGNISVAQAAIADSSHHEHRTKVFGMMGAIFGFGFIIGPFLGGVLSTPSHILPFANASTPFIFSGILSLFNAISIYLFFEESIKEKDHERRVDLFGGFKNILKAQKFSKEVQILFICSFLFNTGSAFFYSFFNVYMTNKFNLSPAQIGNFFAYIGIWAILTQVIIVRYLAKKYKEVDVLGPAYLINALGIAAYLMPQKALYVLFIVPLASIPNGIQMANFSSFLTKETPEKMRGEVLGVSSSVSSLGQSIPPIVAGVVAALFAPSAPILFGAIIVFSAGIIFIYKIKMGR